MKLSKSTKILIGVLTIAQLFIGLVALIWLFGSFLPVAITGDEEAIKSLLLASLGGFIIGVVCMSVLSLGVFIFYVVHAGTNKMISTTMRVVWIVLFFIFGSIVEVVYFFMEIVPEKSMTSTIESGQGAS